MLDASGLLVVFFVFHHSLFSFTFFFFFIKYANLVLELLKIQSHSSWIFFFQFDVTGFLTIQS